MTHNDIPSGLKPYFQEYDPRTLDLDRDANLIMLSIFARRGPVVFA